jgi:teichuronic acid biosynthesis protein TuaF
MSFYENESLKRIISRFKKLFILLLLIPVVLGVLGYFLGMNQETSSKATAAIMLGEFESFEYTDTGAVQEFFKNPKDLKYLKDQYNLSYNPDELAGKTNPVIKPGKVIELEYSADSKEKAEKVLKELVDSFLDESEKIYSVEKDGWEKEYKKTTDQNALFSIKDKLNKLTKSEIHKEVSVEEKSKNPMRQAILGFLIGLMFSITILLAPEVFRK